MTSVILLSPRAASQINLKVHAAKQPDDIFIQGNTLCRDKTIVQLEPRLRRVFLILASRLGRFVTYDEMVEILWGDDADGGPDCATNNIKVAIAGLRDVGAALGFRINLNWGRGVGMFAVTRRTVTAEQVLEEMA